MLAYRVPRVWLEEKAPRSSPGRPFIPFTTPATEAGVMAPDWSFISTAVSTSLMPWPRVPKRPVSGSAKVRVPMPAMESRIQAPSLYWPSSLDWAAWAVISWLTSFRVMVRVIACPWSSWSMAWTASMELTWVPLMWVITSPGWSPQARAGEASPWSVVRSDSPTTSTPWAKSLMPTALPRGTT